MNRELNFFADEDVEVLRSLIAREKQRPLNAPYRNNPAPNTDQMPEVHVAKTTGLMPALEVHPTGQDEPGSALCTIYRLLEGKLWSLTIPTAVVYNLGSSPIPSGSWVLVQRDKFGDWFVGEGIPGGGNGGTEWKALTFTSDTGSTADSDPGNGLFKWNHATQGSATVLYFDDLTEDGVSTTTYFASLPATGFIRLQQYSDSTKWQLWKWTLITDASGYTKFAVVLQMSLGSIADNVTVLVQFMPLSAGTLIIEEEDGTPTGTFTIFKVPNDKLTDNLDGTASFRPVKVSPNDTTDGFLNGKLVNDGTIDFTENNDGGDETLTIARAAIGGTLSVPAGSNTGRLIPGGFLRTGWAADTPYQPSANNSTIVIATGAFGLKDGDNASVTLQIGANPPASLICQANGQVSDHDDTDAVHWVPWTMVGIVSAGEYYMIAQFTNNGTPGFTYNDPLQEWTV